MDKIDKKEMIRRAQECVNAKQYMFGKYPNQTVVDIEVDDSCDPSFAFTFADGKVARGFGAPGAWVTQGIRYGVKGGGPV